MKWQDFSIPAIIGEAIDIIVLLAYITLQIYYSVEYHVSWYSVGMNILVAGLIYLALTILAMHPERVNRLSEADCTGLIRIYSLRMLRLVKFVFMLSLLVPCICDVVGIELPSIYNVATIVIMLLTAVYYEVKILQILMERK